MLDMDKIMTVTVPEGEKGGMRVQRFTVAPGTTEGARLALRGRGVRPGTYTALRDHGHLWMSDTPAEKRDHVWAVHQIAKPDTRRVLINGLGLGMVLAAALSFDHVEHVDVVELDRRVIDLVGPHYTKDPRVTIHQGDAYEVARTWAPGTRWNVGWSDIWQDITTDDLPGHARLNRSYGRRCDWHECWVHDDLVYRKSMERREEKRLADWLS
jgi:hypothetical protein